MMTYVFHCNSCKDILEVTEEYEGQDMHGIVDAAGSRHGLASRGGKCFFNAEKCLVLTEMRKH